MSDEQLPATIPKNKGGRPKGYPKSGGRLKGSTNKIHGAILREMLMKKSLHIKAIEKIAELLDSEDEKIVLAAAREITNRVFGKVQDEQANLDRQLQIQALERAAANPANRIQVVVVEAGGVRETVTKAIDVTPQLIEGEEVEDGAD